MMSRFYKKKGKSFLSLIATMLALVLSGCVNNYQKFYKDVTNGNNTPFAAFSGEPRLAALGPDTRRAILNLYEDGYGLIGVSSFVGPAASDSAAISQAKSVGAAVVLLGRKFQSTATGSIPITTPTSTTSYSSGTVNAFGTGGSAFGNYMGTTTTYGTQTTYVPYSIDRYEQGALFFAPLKRSGLGVFLDKLTDEQRQRAGTNQGLQIVAVRRGSPAFLNDVLPGDLLITIDGQAVFDLASLRRLVDAAAGRAAELALVRRDQRITKIVQIPIGEW